MKIYDKEIYKKQENMRIAILIIVVFLIGFFVGYIANAGNVADKNEANTSFNAMEVIE